MLRKYKESSYNVIRKTKIYIMESTVKETVHYPESNRKAFEKYHQSTEKVLGTHQATHHASHIAYYSSNITHHTKYPFWENLEVS